MAEKPWGYTYSTGDELNTFDAYAPFLRQLSKRTLAVWGRSLYPDQGGYAANGPGLGFPYAITANELPINGRVLCGEAVQADGGSPMPAPDPMALYGITPGTRVSILGGANVINQGSGSGAVAAGLSWRGLQDLTLALTQHFYDPALVGNTDPAFWNQYAYASEHPDPENPGSYVPPLPPPNCPATNGSGNPSGSGSPPDRQVEDPTQPGYPLPLIYLYPYWPGTCGFTRKREREITSLGVSGTTGQRARFTVWKGPRYQDPSGSISTPNIFGLGELMPATPTDQFGFSTLIMDYGPPSGSGSAATYGSGESVNWHVSPDQVTNPDVLTFYGPAELGDILGPWIPNDLYTAIKQLTMTGVAGQWIACPCNETVTYSNAYGPSTNCSGTRNSAYGSPTSTRNIIYGPVGSPTAPYQVTQDTSTVNSLYPQATIPAPFAVTVTFYLATIDNLALEAYSTGAGQEAPASSTLTVSTSTVAVNGTGPTITGNPISNGAVGGASGPIDANNVPPNNTHTVTTNFGFGANASTGALSTGLYGVSAFVDWTSGFANSDGGYGSGEPLQLTAPIDCSQTTPATGPCVGVSTDCTGTGMCGGNTGGGDGGSGGGTTSGSGSASGSTSGSPSGSSSPSGSASGSAPSGSGPSGSPGGGPGSGGTTNGSSGSPGNSGPGGSGTTGGGASNGSSGASGSGANALTPCAGNPVADNSFETPYQPPGDFLLSPTGTAWTYNAGNGNAGVNAASPAGNPSIPFPQPYPDGTQVGFVQGTGSISQTISGRTAGTASTILFYIATNSGAGQLQNPVAVQVNGSTVATVTPPAAGMPWELVGIPFTEPAASYTLALVGTDTTGNRMAGLDFVQVCVGTDTTGSGVVRGGLPSSDCNGQLTGDVIGTPGSYDNAGNTIANAFDGDLGTFVDGATADGNWAGLDLGSDFQVTGAEYAPRSGFASRMVGGQFQVSEAADFSSGVTTLATITAAPVVGEYTSVVFGTAGTGRYVRYLGPDGSYGNVSDLVFLGCAPDDGEGGE